MPNVEKKQYLDSLFPSTEDIDSDWGAETDSPPAVAPVSQSSAPQDAAEEAATELPESPPKAVQPVPVAAVAPESKDAEESAVAESPASAAEDGGDEPASAKAVAKPASDPDADAEAGTSADTGAETSADTDEVSGTVSKAALAKATDAESKPASDAEENKEDAEPSTGSWIGPDKAAQQELRRTVTQPEAASTATPTIQSEPTGSRAPWVLAALVAALGVAFWLSAGGESAPSPQAETRSLKPAVEAPAAPAPKVEAVPVATELKPAEPPPDVEAKERPPEGEPTAEVEVGAAGEAGEAEASEETGKADEAPPPPSDEQDVAEPSAAGAEPAPTKPAEDAPQGAQLVTIETFPWDAEFYRGGKRVGKTKIEVQVKPGQRIGYEVARAGYVTRRLVVDGSRDRIFVGLKRPAGAKPRQP